MVLALLAVLVAPHFIDWGAYRADFEREASRILGQPVTVRGSAEAQILPFPSVTFTDVQIGGGARPPMTVARFRMDAELAPYLSGEIRIFSMRLERPKLQLSIGADGRLENLPRPGTLPTAAEIVLEDVAVTDGEVVVEDKRSDGRLILGALNGNFSARSLLGPVSGAGSLLARGRPLDFQISSGTPDVAKGLPVKLTLDDRALDIATTVDGLVKLDDGMPTFEGALRAASVRRPPEAAGIGEAARLPRVHPDVPVFVLTGNAKAAPGSVSVDALRVSVGAGEKPYVLTGSARLAGGPAPDFRLDLAGEQLDIDAIATGNAPNRKVTFAERLEAARALLADVPRPAMAGRIRLSLPVVAAGDTTIRDLAVEASPLPAGWSVRTLSAELPGRTRIEASGLLDIAAPPSFRGRLLLAARQPSGFSEWLTGSVDPAIRSLNGAGFSADVELSQERQSFRELELDLGGDSLRGSLERSGAAGARFLSADLEGGRLDLDSFSAFSRVFTGEADSFADASNGRLRLAAGPVTFQGANAGRVDADVSFDGTALKLDRADVKDLAGTDLSAKGTLEGLGGAPIGRVDLSLSSADVAPFLDLVAQRLPANIGLDVLRARAAELSPVALSGVLHTEAGAAGDNPTLKVDVSGTLAASDANLNLSLGNGLHGGSEIGRAAADLRVTSSEPAGLLRQMGLDALPLAVPSPLTLTASLSTDAPGPVTARLALNAPGSEFEAKGTVDLAAQTVRSVALDLSGRSDDLGPWLLASGNAFGLDGQASLPATFAGRFEANGENFFLRGIEGSLGAVGFSGDLEKPKEGPVAGEVFLSELSLPWLVSLVYGQTPVGAARPDGWSGQDFTRPLLPQTPVALDVTADRLMLVGNAEAGAISAHIEATPDALSVKDLRGSFGGGYGTASFSFDNANGVGAFAAEADLQGMDLGGISLSGFALPTEDEPAPEGSDTPPLSGLLDAKLRLDASGHSFATLLSSMTGAGSVTVENGAFPGLRPMLLPEILARADIRGFDPTLANVGRLVRDLTKGANYPVSSASADFSVVGGTARFPALRLIRDGEVLNAEGAVDLSRFGVSASLRLDLDPGEEAVEGAAPSITTTLDGPIAAPNLSTDVQLLANYLSVRALEREQARVEAIQGALQEKLRLRREARFYRWRERVRTEAADVDLRSEDSRRREALEAERQRRSFEEDAEARQAERRRLERARAEAARQPEPAAAPEPTPDPGRLNFEDAITPPPAPLPPTGSSDLPGVRQPQPF